MTPRETANKQGNGGRRLGICRKGKGFWVRVSKNSFSGGSSDGVENRGGGGVDTGKEVKQPLPGSPNPYHPIGYKLVVYRPRHRSSEPPCLPQRGATFALSMVIPSLYPAEHGGLVNTEEPKGASFCLGLVAKNTSRQHASRQRYPS